MAAMWGSEPLCYKKIIIGVKREYCNSSINNNSLKAQQFA
jgi:hypothetical protein